MYIFTARLFAKLSYLWFSTPYLLIWTAYDVYDGSSVIRIFTCLSVSACTIACVPYWFLCEHRIFYDRLIESPQRPDPLLLDLWSSPRSKFSNTNHLTPPNKRLLSVNFAVTWNIPCAISIPLKYTSIAHSFYWFVDSCTFSIGYLISEQRFSCPNRRLLVVSRSWWMLMLVRW